MVIVTNKNNNRIKILDHIKTVSILDGSLFFLFYLNIDLLIAYSI